MTDWWESWSFALHCSVVAVKNNVGFGVGSIVLSIDFIKGVEVDFCPAFERCLHARPPICNIMWLFLDYFQIQFGAEPMRMHLVMVAFILSKGLANLFF